MYKSNNPCVQAARTCSWSQERGLHLIPSDRFTHCPITKVNITWAAHELRNISQKDNISSEDIAAATRVVDEALQVGALEEPIPKIIFVLLLPGLILSKHESCSCSA